MTTHDNNARDWIRTAASRLRSADILYSSEGASEAAVELLHEAAERFLKAFLVKNGWELRRIHDLGALVAEAEAFDPAFEKFADVADQLTDQFWAQHYPGGDLAEVGHDYETMREAVGWLAQRVEEAIAQR